MRMKDMFAMAGCVLSGEAKKAYWVKNDNGTVSIMVRLPSDKGNGERVAKALVRAGEVVKEIGDKAAKGVDKHMSCNSFLGSDRNKNLEAVGMATLECDEEVEKNLSMMNIMQI